jgi:hypothetical protein
VKPLLGIDVVYVHSDSRDEDVFRKLQTAFEAIVRYDARRWKRIRTDVRRILVSDSGGPEFIPVLEGCLLSSGAILDSTTTQLALVVVHEATHARLCRAGVKPTFDRRNRVEQLCLRAEEDFAARLPDKDSALALVHAKAAVPWWTDERLLSRREQELRLVGMPAWIIRSARRLRSIARKLS